MKFEIEKEELEAFRRKLPPEEQDEQFYFGRYVFDIVKARFMIAYMRLQPKDADVPRWSSRWWMCGEFNPDITFKLNGVCDADVIWDDIDINVPIIFLEARLPKRALDTQSILIDGHHRLRKAYLMELEWIGAYMIPQIYQSAIQVK